VLVNYLEAEQGIVEILRLKVPELKAIYTPATLGDMQETSQICPAAHVIYNGETVMSRAGGAQASAWDAGIGSLVTAYQYWLVVLVTHNVTAQLQNTSALREDAGQLITKTLKALQGVKVSENTSPLLRITAPAPEYKAGFSYYPFVFTTQVRVNAEEV